ncbi:MAG TPA: ribosome rescue GTPase HflX [Steroidobacteraceae bacterium]|jgi:GTP-binding protein HflX|nr:ribosome rescue GTPase HflX [Steroidobacteraceae bacterium]
MFERPRSGERAVLVRLAIGAPPDPEDILEFTQLALSAGAVPVATLAGRRDRPDPRYFVGSGKADEIRVQAELHNADVVLIDHPLSPSQERNLEKLTGKRVLDRNGLILDIFAQRAASFEGKLEVELAQLKHIASRLVRGWTHLERQRGGGIGLRGPGETQLETDRRLLGQRVKLLTQRLKKIKQQRETGRSARVAIPIPSLALVGYTNAGKSTLFRGLTGAQAFVANQLFATLDPTVRRLMLPGGTQVVVADTVGFIRDLPHELVAAFQSTLTEAREANLLLHVIDASDPRRDEHIGEVNRVLAEIGAEKIPQIRVYNKIDRLETIARIERDIDGAPESVWISAADGVGLHLLQQAVAERLSCAVTRLRLRLPLTAGAARARLFEAGVVVAERTSEEAFDLTVDLPPAEVDALTRLPGARIESCEPAGAYLQSPVPLRASRPR